MKKVMLCSAVMLMMLCGACGSSSGKTGSIDSAKVHPIDTTKLAKGATYYHCEMDPDVISDQPGSCPKCGMDLTKVEKK